MRYFVDLPGLLFKRVGEFFVLFEVSGFVVERNVAAAPAVAAVAKGKRAWKLPPSTHGPNGGIPINDNAELAAVGAHDPVLALRA